MNVRKAMTQGFYISIRLKMIIMLTVVFSILFIGVFRSFYRVSTEMALDNMYSELMDVARNAAEGIDGDMHQALYENPEFDDKQQWPKGKTEERYWQIAEWLYTVHRSNPSAYLYTYLSPEPGKVEFIVSHGAMLNPIDGAPFREPYYPKSPSVILSGLSEETISANVIHDKWGSWVSGFVPIYNSENQIVAAVGVDYYADNINQIQERLTRSFLPFFGISYLVLLVVVFLTSNQLMSPLISLSKSAQSIGEGKGFDEQITPVKLKDELSTLEEIIVDMGRKVRSREEDLKSLTEQLHNFYQSSIAYRENENSVLALNIHDEILSLLAVMSMNDAILENPEFEAQFQELTNRVRKMMSSLRPVMLNYGLWLAIEEYVEECSNRVGIQAAIQLDLPFCDLRYDDVVEENIFRVVQQASENALRHARAASIIIDGEINQEFIQIVIADDGVGFSLEQLDFTSLLNKGHFGLASMFERASLIGANLVINSDPGSGTQVTIEWKNSDR